MIFFHTGILPLLQPFDFDKWSLQFWVFTLNPESKCPISVFIPFYSKGANLHNLIQFQGDKIQFQNSSLCILIFIVVPLSCWVLNILFHPSELLIMGLEIRFRFFVDRSRRFVMRLWMDSPPNLILQCTHKGAVLMNQSQKEPVSGHSPTLSSGTTLTLRDQLWI